MTEPALGGFLPKIGSSFSCVRKRNKRHDDSTGSDGGGPRSLKNVGNAVWQVTSELALTLMLRLFFKYRSNCAGVAPDYACFTANWPG